MIIAKGRVPTSFPRVFISHIAICEETEGGESMRYDGSGELSGRSHKQNYAKTPSCRI